MIKIKRLIITTVALAFTLPGLAAAEVFYFTQAGFSEGAVVNMNFTGTDVDQNGQISSFNGEVTDFNMTFSGNSIVPAFSLGFADLFGLVYDLDGGPLGDGQILDIEGVGANGLEFAYSAGPGPESLCGIGIDCAVVASQALQAQDTSQQLLFRAAGFGPAMAIPTLSVWAVLLLISLMLSVTLFGLQNKFNRS